MKSELPKPAKAWIEAINNADLERLLALMAADHTFYVEGEAPKLLVCVGAYQRIPRCRSFGIATRKRDLGADSAGFVGLSVDYLRW